MRLRGAPVRAGPVDAGAARGFADDGAAAGWSGLADMLTSVGLPP
jgi:hypothetical protein